MRNLAAEKKLTYMLTDAQVNQAKLQGKVIPAASWVSWEPCARVFLMSQRLNDQIGQGLQNPETGERWARLQADIASFIEGGYINWKFMKWLDPQKQECWTLRSVRPRPGLRVFGRFAQPDVFVGTHVVERRTLKEKQSNEWEVEKLTCEEIWNSIFSGKPFSAAHYEQYITENASQEIKV